MSMENPRVNAMETPEANAGSESPEQIVAKQVQEMVLLLNDRLKLRDSIKKEKQGWRGAWKRVPPEEVETEVVKRWAPSAQRLRELLEPTGRSVPTTNHEFLMLHAAIEVGNVKRELLAKLFPSSVRPPQSGSGEAAPTPPVADSLPPALSTIFNSPPSI